jgi:zinc protease
VHRTRQPSATCFAPHPARLRRAVTTRAARVALCAFVSLSTSALAQEAAAPATAEPAAPAVAPPPSLAFEKFTLDNGLEVIIHEDHRQPHVTVDVWYHVGAFEEDKGRTGFAHLFEHLMFQGSTHVPAEAHFRLLEEAGASVINGTTDFDRTNYFETVPRHELELALWLEADRMGWLMEPMTQARLDEQRGVVKNERRQTTEGQPWGLAEEKLWQAVIPAYHPYHGLVIGSQADLDAATLDDVRRFYGRYYAPSNATLCIAGDVTVADAKKLVDKYFRTLPTWPKPEKPRISPPTLWSEVRVTHGETVGSLPRVELLWLVPGRGQPGELDLEVLAYILGDGISSKLQEALLVQNELAQSVDVGLETAANFSAFRIAAVVRPGVDPEEVLNTIQAQLDYLKEIPVQPDEVKRAQRRIETEAVFALETGSVRAEVLQSHNHYDGDPAAFTKRLLQLRGVTDTSVMAALARYLPREHRAVLVAKPKAAAPSAAAAAAPQEPK